MFPSASCQATVFISRRRFTVSLRLRESPGSRDPFGAPFGRLQYLKKKLFFCSLTASFQSNSIEIDTIQFSVKNAVCLTASHIVDGKSNGGRVGCRCCRFESPPYRRIIFSIKSNFFNAIWFAVLHSTSWDFSIFFFSDSYGVKFRKWNGGAFRCRRWILWFFFFISQMNLNRNLYRQNQHKKKL